MDDVTFADLAAALAHDARVEILSVLDGGTTVGMGELSEHLGVNPATTCHHVDALERVGLVRRMRRGREVWLEATCTVEIVVTPRSLDGFVERQV